MAKLTVTIIIISLLFIVTCSASLMIDKNGGITVRTSESNNQREFDYFALALQWPSTYCRKTRHCCKASGCCRSDGPPQHFTIHGLWADYNDGTWPACCGNKNFVEKEIATLRKALDEHWPTLSCGSTSTCHGHKGSFYAHEWEKHGTCSATVTGEEYNYFLTTLNVYFKYNVTEVLNEAGYIPSNSEKYPLGGVITAIENAFHTSPQIICSSDAIQEIRLCFYKDFKPRDCAIASGVGKLFSRSSCPKFVSLPAYVPSGMLSKGKILSQSSPGVEDQ